MELVPGHPEYERRCAALTTLVFDTIQGRDDEDDEFLEDEALRQMYIRVARTLTDRPPTSSAPFTEHPLFFAIDVHQENVEEDIRDSVSEEAMLRAGLRYP